MYRVKEITQPTGRVPGLKNKTMKVYIITWDREIANMVETRIKNSRKVVSYNTTDNGFTFVVTFKSGTKYDDMKKIANGQTISLAD